MGYRRASIIIPWDSVGIVRGRWDAVESRWDTVGSWWGIRWGTRIETEWNALGYTVNIRRNTLQYRGNSVGYCAIPRYTIRRKYEWACPLQPINQIRSYDSIVWAITLP